MKRIGEWKPPRVIIIIIVAFSQENLSLGFPTRSYPNQAAQLQRLARNLKFCLLEVVKISKAPMFRLVCAFAVRKPPKSGFLTWRQYSIYIFQLLFLYLQGLLAQFDQLFVHAW